MLLNNHIFKDRLPIMTQAVDAYALREKTISKNIANANTPGYVPEMVKFEEFFQQDNSGAQLSATNENHLATDNGYSNNISAEVVKRNMSPGDVNFSGDNQVNIDREMSDLAENQIRFRLASKMIKRYFSSLNTAITGTRE